METVSHSQLCAGLNLSRARVDQWIARGLLRLETESSQGRAREWTKGDAMKLAALSDMADAGLPLDKVAPHVQFLTGFKNEPAYLVVYYGVVRIMATSRRGAPINPDGVDAIVPGIAWHTLNESLYRDNAFRTGYAVLLMLDLVARHGSAELARQCARYLLLDRRLRREAKAAQSAGPETAP